ncbi:hypothetical protein CRM22_009088 [Opisthorchis felineus]|uniref:LIM zinc-binding domain-containing protein n=1 Tax=Opisthorchis felineus TaxID=147828 RepID=A0A4S2L8W7_OPIFE|nr:hypothetical protein CRM22_009088 [Opisthorchis felineus]
MAIVCAGCGDPIVERTLLNALDRFWHTGCLNCSCCGLRLDELGPSVFVRSDMLLCRQDYLRLFGLSGTCAKCRQKIPPDELVMRCQESVYHVRCFCCFHCHAQLNPGDKVCLVEGNLFCELEFPQLFSTTTVKWSPTMKPPNQAISNLLMTSTNQTDLLRNLVQHQQQQDLNTKPALFVRSPGYPNPPDGQNVGSIRYSPVPINHSDFPGTLSSHPESPVMTMINPNHMFPDNPLTPNSGLGLSDIDPSFNTESISIVQTLTTDKQANKGNTAAGGQGNEPTTPSGRKKQKKVDSRRCPPLRVC